jgi:[histone H3]-trimethyl-L-lysine4 demethylase
LRLRFSDEELEQLIYKCTDNSQVASAWVEKLRKTMSKSQAPSIKTLRPLLQEAAKLSLVIEEVLTLKDYVEQIEKWTEEANSFLVRKSKWRKSEHDDKQSSLEYARGHTYDTIKRLLQQSKDLAFSAPEVALLQQHVDLLDDFATRAHDVLENPKATLSECQNVLKLGSTININTIEYTHLQNLAGQLEWKRTVGDKIDRFHDYSQVTSLIDQAQECDIPANNELLIALEERAAEASVWVKQASSVLEQPLIKPEDLHQVLDSAKNARVISVDLRNKAQNLLNQYNEATRLAQSMLQARQDLRTDWKPPVSDLNKILKLINYLPMTIMGADLFHEEIYLMDRWRAKLKQVMSVSEHSQGARSMEMVLTHLEHNAIQVTAHRNNSLSPAHPTDIPITQDVFCICRSSESGLMIECDTCGEWYHGNCVRVSRREAKAQTSYICPVCSITAPFSDRPNLEEFEDLLHEADQRWFASSEYTILQSLVARVARFREEVRNFCRSKPQLGVEDVPDIRNYLRKLMGIDVYLQDETEFLSEKMRVLFPPPALTTGKRLTNAGRKTSIDRPRGGKKPMGSSQHPRNRKSSDTSISFKNESDDDIDNDPSYEPVARQQQQSPLQSHSSHHSHPYHDVSHAKVTQPREEVEDSQVYCLCRRRVSDTKNNSMIQCDVCEDWFHLDCVNLSSTVVDRIGKYMCPACSHSRHLTYPYGQVRMLDACKFYQRFGKQT